jgi:hypothetical protein
MKKLFLSILVICSLLSGNAYADEFADCSYNKILNKVSPCDRGDVLKKHLEDIFLDLLPRPKNVSIKEYRSLINKRIQEWDAGADQRSREYDAQRKKDVDFRCEILGGRANNWFSSRKIYKSCMKAEGY